MSDETKCAGCGAEISAADSGRTQYRCGSYIDPNDGQLVRSPACHAGELVAARAEIERLKRLASELITSIHDAGIDAGCSCSDFPEHADEPEEPLCLTCKTRSAMAKYAYDVARSRP